jgi:citrate-Mg2+:H+ or citrate-Ca2+:H+ symporter, CitMHS family
MLALVDLITVILLLGVITSRAMSPLVALLVVPVTAALIAGCGFKTAQFMLSGVQQTAPVAAMFVFAILSRDISASWIGR